MFPQEAYQEGERERERKAVEHGTSPSGIIDCFCTYVFKLTVWETTLFTPVFCVQL